jgi:hypothetical protein
MNFHASDPFLRVQGLIIRRPIAPAHRLPANRAVVPRRS